mmetsp:Transcript_48314/g.149059  ORF Transcript_48314/g.149059 Transcript_48314/m.149059 type:complete len:231 (-) Transcript_48314:90-782(-)
MLGQVAARVEEERCVVLHLGPRRRGGALERAAGDVVEEDACEHRDVAPGCLHHGVVAGADGLVDRHVRPVGVRRHVDRDAAAGLLRPRVDRDVVASPFEIEHVEGHRGALRDDDAEAERARLQPVRAAALDAGPDEQTQVRRVGGPEAPPEEDLHGVRRGQRQARLDQRALGDDEADAAEADGGEVAAEAVTHDAVALHIGSLGVRGDGHKGQRQQHRGDDRDETKHGLG